MPAEWAGRAIRCRRLDMLSVECIARGYLAGLGLDSYRATGTVSGVPLPPGLAEGSRLPEPIFTPTTKATTGHDEFMTFDDVVAAGRRRDRGRAAKDHARGVPPRRRPGRRAAASSSPTPNWSSAGQPTGQLVLADEVLTSDSSRFWAAEDWQPGRPQRYLDKQFVRDWSSTITGLGPHAHPGPPIPAAIVEATRARYIEVYERITQDRWQEASTMQFYDPNKLIDRRAGTPAQPRPDPPRSQTASPRRPARARCCAAWASRQRSTP